MARATQRTWLSLDRWAEIIGVNPLYFNGLDSTTIFPTTRCPSPWQQYAWQLADQVSREDLSHAIREAELIIADAVGYHLLPDWVIAEDMQNTRPADPTLYNAYGLNVRGLPKSVDTEWAYVISGGQRATSVIEAAAAVVRTDQDGTGYAETMTVIVATTITDADEIRVYYPGEGGNDEWEIRPIKVSISGGNATITFKSWQLVDPDLQEELHPTTAIDADAAASYLSTVDVYRVYNDPQEQVQFLWEGDPSNCYTCGGAGCTHCTHGSQNGCLMVRDQRLGIVAYKPASWSATDSEFKTASWAVGRDPERLRLWYYSGWRDRKLDRPNNDMDIYWEQAIAYFAASLLDRQTCGCSNISELIKKMQMDKTKTDRQGGFIVSPSQIDNNFGSKEGALFALRRTRQPQRRVGRK